MQRKTGSFAIADEQLTIFKRRMLNWANQFGILLFLDSNEYNLPESWYECLLACGVHKIISGDTGDDLNSLQTLHNKHQDWIFGHLAYDLKNELEPRLRSNKPAKTGFSDLSFFVPEIVCGINAGEHELFIESLTEDPSVIFQKILAASEIISNKSLPKLSFHTNVDQPTYLKRIAALKEHIREGDCYEINFCCEGFCETNSLASLEVFDALNTLSRAPFAAFYKLNQLHMMCASPERYLKKEGRRIVSQPIKGTARRSDNALLDEQLKNQLLQSEKERAENVMIVDLVRNDLARSCSVGSIRVDELFGIYSFPQVHQMISTVSGSLQEGVHFTDAIRHSFPMGSMTGAPKIKVMELIEQYEEQRRELFSGSVGYIMPNGDFDFNVVIRSLFYDEQTGRLSYQTGGAITWDSDAAEEWAEMRLKAWAMERIFS